MNHVASLNSASSADTQYKVLFIGRHGEGYHNVAQDYYGTPAWNCYWSELDGNGTISWEDASITLNGVAQAQTANKFWSSQIANQGMIAPQSFYTSPLTRCLQTISITFDGIDGVPQPFAPTVKEFFREGISMHTCDHRSNKTYIHNSYPDFVFEDGFTEFDELWNGVTAESSSAQDRRSKVVLDSVFASDKNTYISITSHSGEGASMLRVLNHISFNLNTGAVIPVLVKAVTLNETAPYTSVAPWAGAATCTVPPITSLATGGCICPSTTSSSLPAISTGVANSTVAMTTSVVYTTSVHTVTACPATVTDCPVGQVITSTIALYTTYCPVTAAAATTTSPYATLCSATAAVPVTTSLILPAEGATTAKASTAATTPYAISGTGAASATTGSPATFTGAAVAQVASSFMAIGGLVIVALL